MRTPVILCVDDDAGIRELYEAWFAKTGFEVVSSSNGRQALDIFHIMSSEIDAVILDFEMPGMNGLELAARLKAQNPLLPIVMISALDPESEQMSPVVDLALRKGTLMSEITAQLELLLMPQEITPSSTEDRVQTM